MILNNFRYCFHPNMSEFHVALNTFIDLNAALLTTTVLCYSYLETSTVMHDCEESTLDLDIFFTIFFLLTQFQTCFDSHRKKINRNTPYHWYRSPPDTSRSQCSASNNSPPLPLSWLGRLNNPPSRSKKALSHLV